ncbi:LysR family transcriptional regulator [Agrobacterium sp. S2]|nr:LysR family transcriptional regulator [Agrobacterium sp. S2]
MRDIHPQRLRYFYAVTVSGSIRGAAERLNTAPSVITRQIRLLEEELGAKLFERTISGSAPTEAAVEVLKYWKASRLQLEDLEQRINEIGNLSRGHVRLAVGEGFAPGLQQQVIIPFSALHPNIHFTVEVLGVTDILEAVADGICHLGIAFNAPASHRVVSLAEVDVPLRMLVRPQHPLASAIGPLTIREAFSHPLALLTPSYGIRKILDHIAYSEEEQMIAALTTNNLRMLIDQALKADIGTFLDPFHVAEYLETGQLVALSIDHPLLVSGKASILVRSGQTLPKPAREVLDWILNKSSVFAKR